MTREQIIIGLKVIADEDDIVFCKCEWLSVKDICYAAIKALEQEPCETITEIPKDYVYDTETNDFIVYRHKYTGEEIHIKKPVRTYELEHCDDAISRNEVDRIFQMCRGSGEDTVIAIYENILDLPSVYPKTIECEDAVSREAVLAKKVYTETEEGWSGFTVDVKDIEKLPSVLPKLEEYEEVISREGVLEILQWKTLPLDFRTILSKRVNNLPSVYPAQRNGRWIDNKNGTYTCESCGCKHSRSKFCPDCGCRMVEPQEKEK